MMRDLLRVCVFASALALAIASCRPKEPLEPTPIAAFGATATPLHTPAPILTATPSPTATTIPTSTPTKTLAVTPTPTATAAPTSAQSTAPVVKETGNVTPSPQASSVAATCRESIDGMRALTEDLGLPDHLLEENSTKTSDDFDVNSLLAALDHITVVEGYTLDFVYFADDLGGKPLIYARAADESPYTTYAEFIEAAGGASFWERSYGSLEHAYDYLETIETDDTPDGYLQFIIMATIGDQFYLYWHSLYHDEVILCDVSDVQKAAEEVQGFEMELPEDSIAQAQALDLEPTVQLDEETATVRFVLFTKWGGFIEVWYTLTREFPHEVVDGGSTVLIEYDCGVSF